MTSRDFYVKVKDAKGRYCFQFAGSDAEIRIHNHPGHYLTYAQPGCTTQRRIDPDNLTLQAALTLFREALLKGLRDAYRPKTPAGISDAVAQQAWDAYLAVFQAHGASALPNYLEFPSLAALVEQGTQALLNNDLLCRLAQPVPLDVHFCAAVRAGTLVKVLNCNGTESTIVLGGAVGQSADLPSWVAEGTMVLAYLPGASVDTAIEYPSA